MSFTMIDTVNNTAQANIYKFMLRYFMITPTHILTVKHVNTSAGAEYN
jgi:hypothetical protein